VPESAERFSSSRGHKCSILIAGQKRSDTRVEELMAHYAKQAAPASELENKFGFANHRTTDIQVYDCNYHEKGRQLSRLASARYAHSNRIKRVEGQMNLLLWSKILPVADPHHLGEHSGPGG
jgi:hypothetical protein